MKRKQNEPTDAANLRRRAEERWQARKQHPLSEADTQRLLHELQVHEIELEMQNEELCQTQSELATALERYTELYDFAPAGYFILDAHGAIRQANLTGARLLGVERSLLTHRRFRLFLAEGDRLPFSAFLEKVFANPDRAVCEVALAQPEGQPPLYVRIKGTRSADGQEVRAVVLDITERKQVETALRESEERYRGLFEAESDAILLVDWETGRIIEANSAALKLYGYGREEFLALNTSDVSAEPGDTQQAMGSLVPHVPLRWHRKKDGTVFPIEISGSYFTYRGRKAHVAAIRDITGRRQAEEQIESLALFPLRNPGPVFRVDGEGVVIMANPVATELGLRPGARLAELLPDLAALDLVSCLGLGQKLVREAPLHERHFQFSIQGEPALGFLQLFGADITERKQVEERAEHLHERMALAASAARLGIWDWDIPKNELIWDDPMYDLYGLKKEDFGGAYDAWLKAVHPDDRARAHEHAEAAMRRGEDYVWEFRVVWPDGSVHHLNSHGHFVRATDGTPRRLIGINYDITARKQVERALVESQALHAAIVDSTSDLIWSVDDQRFGLLTFNRALGDYFLEARHLRIQIGYRPEDLLPADYAQRWYDMYQRALREGPYTIEYVVHDQTRRLELSFNLLRREGTGFGISVFGKDITARHQAETAMRASEDRYRAVVEDQTEIISRFREDGTYTFVNEVFCRFFGRTSQELVGRTWQPQAVTEDLSLIEERLHSLSPANPVVVIENRVYSGTGEVRWMQFVNRGFFDAVGQLVETQAVGRDITERRRAEEALHTSQRQFQSLFHNAPLTSVYYRLIRDAQGEIVDWEMTDINALGAASLGKPPSELLGRRATELFGAEVMAPYLEISRQVARSGQARHLETTFAHNGRTYLTSLFLVDGDHYANISLDITDRKRAEAALRESEQLFATVFRASAAAIGISRLADGQFVDINEAFVRLYGYPRAEVIGHTSEELGLWHSPNRTSIFRQLGETKGYQVVEMQGRRRNGEICDLVASIALIELAGEPCVLGILTDITAQKRAEAAVHHLSTRLLQVQDEEARRLARELHDTVGQNQALLCIHLALLQNALPKLRVHVKRLLTQAVALAEQCTSEVRTSSYLLYPPMLDDLGLAAALRDHADSFARRTGVRVDLELPPALARLPKNTELALFRVAQESLANLYRHSGSETASLTLTQTPDQLRLEVRDQGHGMQPPPPRPEGEPAPRLGIGISGMRERMRQLGGTLEIQSHDQGTTVIATLPRNPESAASVLPAETAPPPIPGDAP